MKLRKLILFALALFLLTTSVAAAGYPDVPQTHWAYAQVDRLSGEITGYPDGTFRPEKTVTRAEFINLFVRLAYPEDLQDKKADPWWKPACEVCIEKELLDASSATATYMNQPMPRGEITQLLGDYCSGWGGINECADAAAQFSINWPEKRLEIPEESTLFSDVPADLQSILQYAQQGFYYDRLLSCVNQGLMTGYPDGTFHPERSITRAEAATVLSRLKTQLFLREKGIFYLCTVGQYWLAQWQTPSAVGLSLYDPLTGQTHECVCHRQITDMTELTSQLYPRLLSGGDGVCVWGLFGLYRKNGDALDILCSDPVLDYCQDGETIYYLTCPFCAPAQYSGAAVSWPCGDSVCRLTHDADGFHHLVLAQCETNENGLRKPTQNLTDIYLQNGKLYVAGSYYMGMADHHGALFEVADGKLSALFGEY